MQMRKRGAPGPLGDHAVRSPNAAVRDGLQERPRGGNANCAETIERLYYKTARGRRCRILHTVGCLSRANVSRR
jgi:hypothetical protein